MGRILNGVKQGRHIINGSKHNDVINGAKVWSQTLPTTITITGSAGTAGNPVTLSGRLTDSKNNGVANVQVKIVTNGTTYNPTTNESGNWSQIVTYTAVGSFAATATFEGNATYDSCSAANYTVVISKSNTVLTIWSTSGPKNTNVPITGRLITAAGNPVVGVTVSVSVGALGTSGITGSDGYFTAYILNNGTGTFGMTASWAGNTSYNACVSNAGTTVTFT